MKNKILQIIADNSVERNSSQYGQGRFADNDAISDMAKSISELIKRDCSEREANLRNLFTDLEHDIERCSMDGVGGNGIVINDAIISMREIQAFIHENKQ